MVTLPPLYLRRKSLLCPLNRRLGGHQRRSGKTGKEKKNLFPLQGIEPRSLDCLIPSLVPIPSELSGIHLLFQMDH
jgi:hypothetical protein